MGLKLACRDLEPNLTCPYVARGENMEEVQVDRTQHAKTVHNYTDDQLNDPKMVAAIKAGVKLEWKQFIIMRKMKRS